MQKLIIKIAPEHEYLITDEKLQCFVIDSGENEEFITRFIASAHQAGKLILICGDNATESYQKFAADGFVLDLSKEEKPQKIVKSVKKQFPQAVIGIISRNRRHEAMLISECEPDFVVFKVWQEGFAQNKELLAWYNELFLIQSAAWVEEMFAECYSAPTDFLILSSAQFLAQK